MEHRLQTRVLLLIEQIQSYMSNSSPVATIYVDYKSAFDQLWFKGCIDKLKRKGIPIPYVNWIHAWLIKRHAVIEIARVKSRWFEIMKGGPQGSSFTATLFITYHADMEYFIPGAMSFLFAADLAAVLAGQIGIKFTQRYMELEKRLHIFFEQLEFYVVLTVQPINCIKTKGMFSARAINYPNPMPDIRCEKNEIEWVKVFKYLGYWLTTKLGWGNMINQACKKIRQQTAMINSIRVSDTTSIPLRIALFSTFVIPFFTWLFALYPLFTNCQRLTLSHFYYTSLKRVYHCLQWGDLYFSYTYAEKSLDDHCYNYWLKYLNALSQSNDGHLLDEQSVTN
ncbi:unnamed protein product, partial [Didymodactylos carnosus]